MIVWDYENSVKPERPVLNFHYVHYTSTLSEDEQMLMILFDAPKSCCQDYETDCVGYRIITVITFTLIRFVWSIILVLIIGEVMSMLMLN